MDDQSKAVAAQRILEDAVFNEAVSAYVKQLTGEWGRETDPVRREQLWNQQHALTMVLTNLRIIMDKGYVKKIKTKEGWL